MAHKTLSLIMLSALMISATAAYGGRKALSSDSSPDAETLPLPAGFDLGFVPLRNKDPKVVKLAQYAVDEYNKASKAKLVYYSVFEALLTERDGGKNYALVVGALNEKKVLSTYQANVFVDKADHKKVSGFKKTD